MSNQSRVVLITLLLVFGFGTWFLPSQAQRSSQRSAPSGKATPSKSPAAKPTTGLPRAIQSKSVDAVEFHAVGFAESPPARDLPAAGTLILAPRTQKAVRLTNSTLKADARP